eukprot:365441-Chlamydomonas_euryale.AAC.5
MSPPPCFPANRATLSRSDGRAAGCCNAMRRTQGSPTQGGREEEERACDCAAASKAGPKPSCAVSSSRHSLCSLQPYAFPSTTAVSHLAFPPTWPHAAADGVADVQERAALDPGAECHLLCYCCCSAAAGLMLHRPVPPQSCGSLQTCPHSRAP